MKYIFLFVMLAFVGCNTQTKEDKSYLLMKTPTIVDIYGNRVSLVDTIGNEVAVKTFTVSDSLSGILKVGQRVDFKQFLLEVNKNAPYGRRIILVGLLVFAAVAALYIFFKYNIYYKYHIYFKYFITQFRELKKLKKSSFARKRKRSH